MLFINIRSKCGWIARALIALSLATGAPVSVAAADAVSQPGGQAEAPAVVQQPASKKALN